MQAVAEWLSLVLTIPTIALAVAVLILWGPRAFGYLKPESRSKDEREEQTRWLIVGVTVSFLGSAFDNLYWGAAWTAEYLKLPIRDTLFLKGAYSNIPFRQLAGILAAYCHLRAAFSGVSNRLFRLVACSVLGGALFGGVLFLIR